MKKTIIISVTIILLLGTKSLFAQLMLKQITLKEQIENSSLVVEGKVISKKTFWGANKKNIYTTNTVEVYKVFKGEKTSKIDIITRGGSIDSNYQMITHSLKLNIGDLGVFTLFNNDNITFSKNESDKKQFQVYSSLQGFYKYDLHEGAVTNPFNSKKRISNTFYKEIMHHTKSKYISVHNIDFENKSFKKDNNANIPTAITFSPTTVSAGTKDKITITIPGSASGNFGSTKGKVSFRNSNSGGNDYIDALNTQIISWSNTSIVVEVPSDAGTGNIRVTDASSNSINSTINLTVSYAEFNHVTELTSAPNVFYALPIRLIKTNSSGGYSFRLNTNFNNNNAAKSSLIKALDKWRCVTGVNFILGETTSINSSSIDGQNVVRFDNGSELPAGTLGQTTFMYSKCGTTLSDTQVFPTEIDIVFDGDTTWYYGNSLPGFEFDFESVVLHELGHAHQLGHVIDDSLPKDNANDVMNFNLALAEQQRVLAPNNIIAANKIKDRSLITLACSTTKTAMTPHPCAPLSTDVDNNILKNSISISPNPSSGKFQIKNNSLINFKKIAIYDVNGKLVVQQKISSKTNNINLSSASKGLYFINIYTNTNNFITKKLIIN